MRTRIPLRGFAALLWLFSLPAGAQTTAPSHDLHDYDSQHHGISDDLQELNPQFQVIIDAVGSWSSDRENEAYNRFDVREVELQLRGTIHAKVDVFAVLAFERHVHNPVFPELEEEAEEVESDVNIEAAYGYFHDFGVENLSAKLGRFRLHFGRQNLLHLHELPTIDPPMVNQAFLAPESLADSGLSLNYVLPKRIGQHIELTAEIVTGEGASSESPTLNDDIEADSPAFNFHAMWNRDLARDVNLELGTSWLTAQGNSSVNLYGFDATLTRGETMIQAEAIYGNVDDESAWGFYVLGQQEFHRDWHAGVRVDWTE